MSHQLTQIYVDFLSQVENEKAQFEQEEAVTRVKSDYLVKNILNQGWLWFLTIRIERSNGTFFW